MEEEKKNYTSGYRVEELIEILDDLSKHLAWVQYRKERPHLFTKEYMQKVDDLLEELKTSFYSHILSTEYWDHPITVLIIKTYLETGQAQTIEQAVALYNKCDEYTKLILD